MPPNRSTDFPTSNFKRHLWKSIFAILAGNAIYFLLLVPHLPPTAVHQPRHLDLGLLVDFWLCLACFGIVEIILRLSAKPRRIG